MIKIDNIKLSVSHTPEDMAKKIEKALNLRKYYKDDKPQYSCKILRQSLDARKKPELFYVYSVIFMTKKNIEEKILNKNKDPNVGFYKENTYVIPKERGNIRLKGRPVIVGAGPAGLFCAYILCRSGYLPIILERGEKVEDRSKSVEKFWKTGEFKPDSNVQFGEGGAGTFSDGKLNTGVNDKKGRNQYVLDTFIRFGAGEKTGYVAKPHLGTDVLTGIIKNMRNYITEQGGEFRFNTRFSRFTTDEDGINAVIARDLFNNNEIVIDTNCLVLAIGHSARDTFKMLYDSGICMTQKNFAVGLRVEHSQKKINYARYGIGDLAALNLSAADYKVTNHTTNGRNVYSFCNCPGGYVVNASGESGRLAVNGMSYSGRNSDNSNSAIIVGVDKEDFGSEHVLAGMEFQRRLEEKAYELGAGKVPVQLLGDYKNNVVSMGVKDVIPHIKGEYKFANLRELFPEDINKAIIESMDKFSYTIEGFNSDDTVLSGVESRTSSPVRIIRDDNFMGSVMGLYPCGEGAGYAGGITSAAMDGIKVAEAVMARYCN
ncbi:MAG: FAD-dependent oxidoreductase [Lachnospiraceae bacterium]|nr:FAD-dependent oxidoreductase [Lachnospiraceae bacterium]